MRKILCLLSQLVFITSALIYSQGSGKPAGRADRNGLLPDHCYIKYIYDFPYESHQVFYSERFPDLEIRKYLNADLIKPLFNKIIRGNYKVFDPNYRGTVEDLIQAGTPVQIDTNLIMLYMHAGWDTAFSIDNHNQVTAIPIYTQPDLSEISGLFFFEKWDLDTYKGSLNKEVIAYFPIRDYWDEYNLQKGLMERKKRLLFMVYQGTEDSKTGNIRKKSKTAGYQPLYQGITSTLNLYNRPYYEYIHRHEIEHGVSDEEFSEWEYHTFDFYKHFYPEEFLKTLIDLALNGRLKVRDPDTSGKILTRQEIIEKISSTGGKIGYDDLNSVIFNEDWYFNPVSLRIIKKVNSVILVRHEYLYDEYTGDLLKIRKTPLFSISLK